MGPLCICVQYMRCHTVACASCLVFVYETVAKVEASGCFLRTVDDMRSEGQRSVPYLRVHAHCLAFIYGALYSAILKPLQTSIDCIYLSPQPSSCQSVYVRVFFAGLQQQLCGAHAFGHYACITHSGSQCRIRHISTCLAQQIHLLLTHDHLCSESGRLRPASHGSVGLTRKPVFVRFRSCVLRPFYRLNAHWTVSDWLKSNYNTVHLGVCCCLQSDQVSPPLQPIRTQPCWASSVFKRVRKTIPSIRLKGFVASSWVNQARIPAPPVLNTVTKELTTSVRS